MRAGSSCVAAVPPEIRRVIYINAIESLHMRLPNDDAAIKLLWLALRNVLPLRSGASNVRM